MEVYKKESNESNSRISQVEEIKMLDLNQKININFMNEEKKFKILFIGDSEVGKSTIINSIIINKIQNESEYIKTLGCDIRKKSFKLNELSNNQVGITFYDIGRIDVDLNLNTILEYFKIVHACIFIVDAANQNSLKFIKKLSQLNIKKSNSINYLVVNKTDLLFPNDSKSIENNNNRISKIINNDNCVIKKLFNTSINDLNSIKLFFNVILNDLVEFYNTGEQFNIYNEKNKLDNVSLFFKYSKSKNYKKCFNC